LINLATAIEHIYAVTGPAMSLAYLPQIYSVYRDQMGAQSISLFTWFLWTLSLGITSLYGLLVVKNYLFFLASLMSFVGCLLVFIIASLRRIQYLKSQGISHG
jgi:uncharacterized protein with PQ loop repeat